MRREMLASNSEKEVTPNTGTSLTIIGEQEHQKSGSYSNKAVTRWKGIEYTIHASDIRIKLPTTGLTDHSSLHYLIC
jgi:hypothetical protein